MDAAPTLAEPTLDRGTEPLALPSEIKVLIADDMTSNRLLLRRALKKSVSTRLSCVEVARAEDAIEKAAQHAFDLIFMDENFSVEENALLGSDAVRKIRAAEAAAGAARRAVIVSCTGLIDSGPSSGDDTKRPFLQAGSDEVWGKPIPSHTDGSMQRELAALFALRES